jgi:hypothetical protein
MSNTADSNLKNRERVESEPGWNSGRNLESEIRSPGSLKQLISLDAGFTPGMSFGTGYSCRGGNSKSKFEATVCGPQTWLCGDGLEDRIVTGIVTGIVTEPFDT